MSRWSGEWLLLRRDRTAAIIYAFFALACVIAAADSVAAQRREARLHHALVEEEQARMDALRRDLSTPPSTPVAARVDPANPGAIGRVRAATYALLPPSELAVVRSRVVSSTAVAVSTEGGALDRALGDLSQPRVQNLGRFELGFLLLVVLPLFVLLLCFDVVARDHERGTLRILLAQEARPRARYLTRLMLRVLPIVAMTFATIVIAVVITSGLSARTALQLGTLLLVVAVYAGFWASVALVIQAWFRTASASGVMCLAAWAGFVVLLPTALSAIAEANTPIPSRIEMTDASREAARKASIEADGLLSRYLEDHPELVAARTDTADFFVRRVVMDEAIAAARAPVERRFFEAVAHRRTIVHRLALASPVSLFALNLDELGGSSDERVGRFRRDANAFQSSFAAFFNDKTVRGERISMESLASRPTFRFAEGAAVVWPLLALAAWSLALLGLAMLSFRRAVAL